MWVQLNDKLIPAENARVSIFDRGFMYGDGVFETMRAFRRTVFCLEDHLERLDRSAAALKIPLPRSPEQMASDIQHLLKQNLLDEAIVRISISRGVGGRGPAIDDCSQPVYVATAYSLPENLDERERNGISLAIVDIRRTPPQALPAYAKHSNYLNSILASMQAADEGADEALLLSIDGFLAECSTGNLFIVEDSLILTPSLDAGILPGITRAMILELAKQAGIEVKEQPVRPETLFTAAEAFMTNSVVGVLPVRRVNDRNFPVPGPATARLTALYRGAIELSSS